MPLNSIQLGTAEDVPGTQPQRRGRSSAGIIADSSIHSSTGEPLSQPNDTSSDLEDRGDAYQPLPVPTGSRITVERFPDGLTIQLPAAGINGTKGTLFFTVILNGVLAFITAFVLLMFFCQ